MDHFNAEQNDGTMKKFCLNYLSNIIVKDKTCFKNLINPNCTDLIITNRPKSFQESDVIETGLYDFYKMSLMVMKVFYNKKTQKLFNVSVDNRGAMGALMAHLSKVYIMNYIMN